MTEHDRTQRYAEALARLIKIETVSQETQTDLTKFHALHDEMRALFPTLFAKAEVEEFDGSLLLKLTGRDPQRAPFLLMSHHDVVEATGTWTHGPFSGDIADGKLWGRGTLDDKGNIWAMLQAAEELLAEGYVPPADLYFMTTCNEECSGAGSDAISKALLERGIRFDLVLDEGGMIVPEPMAGAKGQFAMIGVGEKGAADLKFIARSAGGHASTPPKNSPLVRLGQFMEAADKANLFTKELSPVTAEMFRRMSPTMSGPLKFVFRHARGLRGLLRHVLPMISPTAAALVKTTLAFTMAEGSGAANVLPLEASVIGNMRYSHHQGREDSIRAVTELAKKYDIETVVLDGGYPSGLTDYNGDAFKLVERAVNAIFPDVVASPYVMTGATDSRHMSRVCDHCVRFAPFRISQQQLDSMHAIDECVDLSALAPAVDFFKYILREY